MGLEGCSWGALAQLQPLSEDCMAGGCGGQFAVGSSGPSPPPSSRFSPQLLYCPSSSPKPPGPALGGTEDPNCNQRQREPVFVRNMLLRQTVPADAEAAPG